MKQVLENLYIGTKYDFYDNEHDESLYFCLCAKTLHQQIAKVDGYDYEGYRGNMSKDQSEYLIADRPSRRLKVVNLIDAPKVEYIPKVIIDSCIDFLEQNINSGKKVLVVCDQGMSRSVGVAFMYMMKQGFFNNCKSYDEAVVQMKMRYPMLEFGKGIEEYAKIFAKDYFER